MISSSCREHFWSQDQLWKTNINQLTLFWFQLMYYRKWPQFGKKWGSRNHHLKTNGFPCIALMTVWIFFPGGSSNVPQQIGWIFFYQEWLLVKNHSILLETLPEKKIHTVTSPMPRTSHCYSIKKVLLTRISKMRISILVQSAESTSGVSPR